MLSEKGLVRLKQRTQMWLRGRHKALLCTCSLLILSMLFGTAVYGQLSISTSALPAATQYQPYSATLAATGGAAPYSWSLTAAAATLPEGMAINQSTGVISSASVMGQGGY